VEYLILYLVVDVEFFLTAAQEKNIKKHLKEKLLITELLV
jgi:hypothetical protein